MNAFRVVLAAVIAMLSGCASYYPLPIAEPKALGKDGTRAQPDYERGGLLYATNIKEAKENLKIYGDSYQEYADRLRRNEYVSSDAGFAGGVVGVVGGIAKSVDAAIAGAVIASGSSIVSQRYQFLVQAANYEKASDAMYCMYAKLYPASDDNLDAGFANERIDEVRRKLRKVQSTVQLASPDISQLEAAIKKAIESANKKSAADSKFNQQRAIGALTDEEKKAADAAALEKLQSDLSACVAAF